MRIAKNKVVMINYVLRDDEGEIIDQSEKNDPLGYLHGHNNLVPGLRKH